MFAHHAQDNDNRPVMALVFFCWFTMNNGFAWLMFAPVTHKVIRFYRPWVDESTLELLNSWQPIVYIFAFFPIMKLLGTHDGLRRCVKLGVSIEFIGSVMKFLSTCLPHEGYCLVFLNLGQICSAIAAPIAIGAPSAVSATWFDADSRTRATAAAVLFNNVGNALVYVVVPTITAYGFQYVIYLEAMMATGAMVGVLLFYPKVPGHVRLETEPDRPLLIQLRELFSNVSVIFMLIVYAWSSGGFVSWTSLFDEMYDPFFGSIFIGNISFVGAIGYVFGGLVTSYLVDLHFRRQMKWVITVCCAANCIACILFTQAMPTSHTPVPEDSRHYLQSNRGWILFTSALCGFFNGGAAPVFYELAAEISYPVEEGVSGNVMSMFENVGSLVMYQIVAKSVPSKDINSSFAAGMMAVTVISTLVRQTYRRMEALEEEERSLGPMKGAASVEAFVPDVDEEEDSDVSPATFRDGERRRLLSQHQSIPTHGSLPTLDETLYNSIHYQPKISVPGGGRSRSNTVTSQPDEEVVRSLQGSFRGSFSTTRASGRLATPATRPSGSGSSFAHPSSASSFHSGNYGTM